MPFPPQQPFQRSPQPPEVQRRPQPPYPLYHDSAPYSSDHHHHQRPSRSRGPGGQLLQRLALVGGWLVALVALGLGWDGYGGSDVIANSVVGDSALVNLFQRKLCREVVQPRAVLSREQLTQLLTIPERSEMEQIRQLVPEPYCRLRDLEVRAGIVAQREAYPLAFDPKTWLVVLSEQGEYAGYGFKFAN